MDSLHTHSVSFCRNLANYVSYSEDSFWCNSTVCPMELMAYNYTSVSWNIQICCYTTNKVLSTNSVYIWIHCIRTLYNFGGILITRFYIRKIPFGTQYCMLHGTNGLQLHVSFIGTYRFVAILSTKSCEITLYTSGFIVYAHYSRCCYGKIGYHSDN